MGANTAFGASGNEAGMMTRGKTKIGLIIGLLVGLVVAVAIGLMVWLNWDHLAIMFDPKFAYYTIDNGDQGKFEIKFYKGATIKKGSELEFLKNLDAASFEPLKNANWLYLKPSDSSKAPLILLAGSATKIDSSDSCNDPSESDTVVSTVNNDKNSVCFQMEQNNIDDKNSTSTVGVIMKFNQKNNTFGVLVTNDTDNVSAGANIAKTIITGSKDDTQAALDEFYNKLDLDSRKDDIKTILASIRVLSEPK